MDRLKTIEGQLILLLAISFALLLGVLALLEVAGQDDVADWAQNEATFARLRRMKSALEVMSAEQRERFLGATSACHEGYTVSEVPFGAGGSVEKKDVAARIARALSLSAERVRVVEVELGRADFAYARCPPGAIEVPARGLVINLQLGSGAWLNAEVHPHEWHLRRDLLGWVARTLGAFFFVGALAVLFVFRLARPLNQLTAAAHRFGAGLEPSTVEEAGPLDLRRAIRAFNAMQRQVARRARTWTAIGHDVRTPLTALRIKAELIEDEERRRDLVTSIEAMDRITRSALELLQGDRRHEPLSSVELGALIESECNNFADAGSEVRYAGEPGVIYPCRPDALASAVRNLIDNALKYGGAAEVSLRRDAEQVSITIADRGPGLASTDRAPKGSGLGLSIVRAIVEGHDGELVLEPNTPHGLSATIRLPNPR